MIRRDRDEVRVLADKDSLTQSLNRRAWNEAAIQAMSNPAARPQALLFLDLDHFKILNDRRGHAAGDEATIAVAHALREELRRPTCSAATAARSSYLGSTAPANRGDAGGHAAGAGASTGWRFR